MNYLAHAFLSFHEPEILVGNLISDFVKGKKKFDYTAGIQKGIALHRAIDNFTDDHIATKQAKEIFRPAYRLYSGAMVDVVYDHFLATDNQIFNNDSLLLFSAGVYETISIYLQGLPEHFQKMFPYMKEHDWLYNYQFRWGIEKSLGGVVRRAAYLYESETAFTLFNQHYNYLKSCYDNFFPELFQMAKQFLANQE
jgi:acyl carrier protein phosphodiesterase